MLFNSGIFLLFFPIVVLGYFLLPKKAKNFWLLVSSYYFYMSWNAVYGLLLLGCTAVTFFAAVGIENIRLGEEGDHGRFCYVMDPSGIILYFCFLMQIPGIFLCIKRTGRCAVLLRRI